MVKINVDYEFVYTAILRMRQYSYSSMVPLVIIDSD